MISSLRYFLANPIFLSLKPQFVLLKKIQQNRILSKKLEIYLLSFLKSSVLILQFFIIFLFFSFMFSTTYVLLSYDQKYRTDQKLSSMMGLQQETKLKNIEFTRLYSVTVLITFSNSNCWRNITNCNIFALWFEYLWACYHYYMTGNQIRKSMIKEDHTNSS